jgi:hypothetical protein
MKFGNGDSAVEVFGGSYFFGVLLAVSMKCVVFWDVMTIKQ